MENTDMNGLKRTAVRLSFLAIVIAALATCFVGNALADDIVSGFSVTNGNPNGPWTYGETKGAGGAFTAFSQGEVNANGIPGVNAWTTPSLYPVVADNTTASSFFTVGTVFWPVGFLNMHPDNGGNDAVVRYTVPSTGTYTISGMFQGDDNQGICTVACAAGTTTDVHILSDGSTSLFSEEVTGFLDQQAFSITGNFTAGETIDFVVGYGTDGNYFNDSTGLQGTITEVSGVPAAPEPSTFALMLAGLLSLVFQRRYRSARVGV
jgi:hypothetical protein